MSWSFSKQSKHCSAFILPDINSIIKLIIHETPENKLSQIQLMIGLVKNCTTFAPNFVTVAGTYGIDSKPASINLLMRSAMPSCKSWDGLKSVFGQEIIFL